MTEIKLNTIVVGDCLDVMGELPDNCIDTIITDPPYGLEFMGKDWDHGVPGVRYWDAALRVAKPGAILMAFGGTRTHHRLACAIEDAGWEIRDTIMWVYGSGFPKSHDISKAIDKAAGAEREVVGSKLGQPGYSLAENRADRERYGQFTSAKVECSITAPSTDAAKLWDGWGTALKPSWEPIVLCRKPLTTVPLDGTIAEIQTMIGGLLCLLLSSANNAEEISKLSPSVSGEVSVSALMLAAVLHGAESGVLYEKMAMLNSPETVSTCLNIAILWSSILDTLLNRGNTFITSMETELTIDLRTLNCLLSTSIPVEVIQAVSHLVGCESNANTVEMNLTNAGPSTARQQDTFAAELVSLNTSKSGISAKSVENNLRAIIPSVVSVLSHARQLITTENEEKLRPNWEPIIVAMKPRDGTFANNALKWGVSGLWVDGGRVGTENIPTHGKRDGTGNSLEWSKYKSSPDYSGNVHQGRWPANLIHDGSEEVVGLFPESSVTGKRTNASKAATVAGTNWLVDNHESTEYTDRGSAARFFYCAKASRSERGEGNSHPTVKPLALMEYLCRLTKTPTGGVVFDPFVGSGTTLLAAKKQGRKFLGCDISEKYVEIARKRLKVVQARLL